MEPKTYRDHAMDFIAAYDKPDADVYEKHVVRISRTWLSIMKARHSVQGIVNRIMDEFSVAAPDEYGCGWDELRKKFTAWAVKNDWWQPDSHASSQR